MSIVKKFFDKTGNNENVNIYTLTNKSGASVQILNYGGIIRSVNIPDKDGALANIVVGFDSIAEYVENGDYYGAIVGRCANRISKGRFSIDGHEYRLALNDGDNHLHGGVNGFNQRIWDVCEIAGTDFDSLELTLFSPDGDENYPGNLNVCVKYTFDDENNLTIDYEAVTDKDTIVNLTNHSYFNLDGAFAGKIGDHSLYIDADYFCVADSTCSPTGEIKSVEGSVLDFRTLRKLGTGLDLIGTEENMSNVNGYDHNFVLNNEKEFRVKAILQSGQSGRKITLSTNQPGLQIYTGNYMKIPHTAVCLETQHFPDAINFPNWPSPILRAGEKYSYKTVLKFN